MKTSGLVLFFKLGTIGLNYAFFLFLSNVFGAAEVGYFALSFTVIQMLSIIGRSGLEIGMFKELSTMQSTVRQIYSNHLKSIYYVFLASALLLLALYFLLSITGGSLFATPATSDYVILFSIAMPFYAIMFFNAEMHRARKRFVWFAIFQNFGMYAILVLFLILRLFVWKWTFDELAWIFIASLIFLSILSFYGTFSYYTGTENARVKEASAGFGDLFKSSIPIGLSALSFFLMSWLDGVVLAQFFPEEVVGKYAIAYRVALLGSFALLSINSALGPRITAFHADHDSDRIISETRKSTKLGFWITIPLILITLIFPRTILGIFGEDFVSAYPAMLILLAGQFINTVMGPTGIVLQLTGHQRIFKNIVLFTVIFNIIANYLIIPVYGIIGAAIVNSASILIWKLWSTFMVRRIFGSTFYYLPLISP